MKLNKSSILYTTAILAFSNIILQFIGFFYRIGLTDLAGTQALGIYKLVMQFYFVILAVSTTGVNLVALNRSSALFGLGDVSKLKKTIRVCVHVFLVILSLCFFFILFSDDFIAQKVLGDIQTKPALYIALVCILLTGIENIIKNSLLGIKKVKHTAFSEICEQLLRMSFVLLLIYYFGDGDYGKIAFLILLGMTLSEIFSVVFLGVTYKKVYKSKKPCTEKVLKPTLKIVLPITLSAALTNIIASASTLVLPSRLMLSGFTREQALSELGIISGIAMPMLILPIAIISSYSIMVMPTIAKSHALGDTKNIRRKINKSFEATGLIGIPLTTILVFLAKPIGRIFFSVDFNMTYLILIGASTVLLYYQIASSNILNGLGFERKVYFHNIVGETTQLVVTFCLCSIPTLNIYGYIIGLIVSPLIVTMLNCTYIFNTYRFRFVKFILNPLFCSFVLFVTSKFSYNFIIGVVGSQWQSILFTLPIVFLMYALILRAFGINYIQYIKNLSLDNNLKYKLK